MDVVISAITTLALYCQRCGKIHLHDISRFSLKRAGQLELTCSCNQVQATLTRTGSRQYLLCIPCVVCQDNHIICLDSKKLWRTQIDKIYCVNDNFELGFVGNRAAISEILAGHKREFERLVRETDNDENEEQIETQQIMLEILNKVHDIAEQGGVYCGCGSGAVEASLLTDCIMLECLKCGGHYMLPAQTEHDLVYAQSLSIIELVSRRCFAHSIDFD